MNITHYNVVLELLKFTNNLYKTYLNIPLTNKEDTKRLHF